MQRKSGVKYFRRHRETKDQFVVVAEKDALIGLDGVLKSKGLNRT